jgi:hypothetical protein
MTSVKTTSVVVALPLLMLAARPADAPQPQVLTLVSPNEEAGGDFGVAVAGAGDVDQDGFVDVIVGAEGEDPGNSPANAGRAYVFSGKDVRLLFELVSPNEITLGSFGHSVAGAGDVNQDGHADLIVGAWGEFGGRGRAYVFGGRDGSILFELASPRMEPGNFAMSVAGAGDVNQDGFADLIVGCHGAERAYVFSGQTGALLLELVSPNEEQGSYFGESVAGAGDVDQDGFADLIVGAWREDPGASPQDAGRAHVFSGRTGSPLLELASPNEVFDGYFGWAVAGAADVNQDGFADLVVGAPGENPGIPSPAGRSYVFSGQSGSLLFELLSPNPSDQAGFGWSVRGAGDVNQDSFADLIVGAPFSSAGSAFVFSGQDGALLSELTSPNAEPDGLFGYSVSGAGDPNQDGFADPIVGAYVEDPDPSPNAAGRAYVFLSPGAFRINSGGPNYTDTSGRLFVADRAYTPGGFGYVGGATRTFDQPVGGTDDDPLYQDVRVAREGNGDGIFAYRFDVASPARYDVTLYLMAPALDGPGNVVMDVQAEADVVFGDLDVTAEAGGEYQALVKTFAVDVSDGTLDLRFRAVNKAAVVSGIAVAAQSARVLPPGRVGGVR